MFLIITCLTPSAFAQQTPNHVSPEKVLNQWVTAFNQGDYETAATFFAEDVVITFVPAFFQPPIVSRQELLAAFQKMAEVEPHMEINLVQSVGEDIFITSTREWDKEAQQMGIEVLEFTEIYVIRDGLIHGASSVLTPHSLELAKAAMAAMSTE